MDRSIVVRRDRENTIKPLGRRKKHSGRGKSRQRVRPRGAAHSELNRGVLGALVGTMDTREPSRASTRASLSAAPIALSLRSAFWGSARGRRHTFETVRQRLTLLYLCCGLMDDVNSIRNEGRASRVTSPLVDILSSGKWNGQIHRENRSDPAPQFRAGGSHHHDRSVTTRWLCSLRDR